MANLHVRSVPDDLYDRIQDLAQSRNRSLSAEVVTLLYQALEQEENRQRQDRLLSAIRRRRAKLSAATVDSVELLRADRSR
jgi:plasmid stability protein